MKMSHAFLIYLFKTIKTDLNFLFLKALILSFASCVTENMVDCEDPLEFLEEESFPFSDVNVDEITFFEDGEIFSICDGCGGDLYLYTKEKFLQLVEAREMKYLCFYYDNSYYVVDTLCRRFHQLKFEFCRELILESDNGSVPLSKGVGIREVEISLLDIEYYLSPITERDTDIGFSEELRQKDNLLFSRITDLIFENGFEDYPKDIYGYILPRLIDYSDSLGGWIFISEVHC